MEQQAQDIMIIRDLIERWVVFRDALLWDRFRTLWHKEGRMKATWFEGPFEESIRTTAEGVTRGLSILHTLGGSTIDVKGLRATSMTRVVISQRAVLDGVCCDVTSHARHLDFWEKREEAWGLVRRETLCDKDRIDPVDSRETVSLDETLLNRFPEAYKHLAYLQTRVGYRVNPDVPRPGSTSLEALYTRAEEWLANQSGGTRQD